MRIRQLMLVVSLGALLLGCDGEDGAGDGPTYTATGIEPFDGPDSLDAGEVTITLVNEDAAGHNLTIEELDEATDTIGEGEQDQVTVELAAGESYTLFCSVPGHREGGMEVTVSAE